MRQFNFRQGGMAGTTTNIALGIAMVVLGLITMTISGSGGIVVGVGILFVIMNIWNASRALITLHDDHLEMKAAPAAPRHQILYRDMTLDDVGAPKKVYLLANGKRIRLPVIALEPVEQHELLQELRTRIQQNAGPK